MPQPPGYKTLAPGHRGYKLSNPVCLTSDTLWPQSYKILKLLTCSNSNKGCRGNKNSHCVTVRLTAWWTDLDYEPKLGCSYFADRKHTGAGARSNVRVHQARSAQSRARASHNPAHTHPILTTIHPFPPPTIVHKPTRALIIKLDMSCIHLVCSMLHWPSRKLELTPPIQQTVNVTKLILGRFNGLKVNLFFDVLSEIPCQFYNIDDLPEHSHPGE